MLAEEARGGRPLELSARGALEEAARRPSKALEPFASPAVLERRDASGELRRDTSWSRRRCRAVRPGVLTVPEEAEGADLAAT